MSITALVLLASIGSVLGLAYLLSWAAGVLGGWVVAAIAVAVLAPLAVLPLWMARLDGQADRKPRGAAWRRRLPAWRRAGHRGQPQTPPPVRESGRDSASAQVHADSRH